MAASKQTDKNYKMVLHLYNNIMWYKHLRSCEIWEKRSENTSRIKGVFLAFWKSPILKCKTIY